MSSYPKFGEPKDPEDIADFEISFADSMPADDSIATVDNVTILAAKVGDASAALDVSVASILHAGQSAIVWLQAGKPGWRYEIGALITSVGGRVFRRRGLLDVKPQ